MFFQMEFLKLLNFWSRSEIIESGLNKPGSRTLAESVLHTSSSEVESWPCVGNIHPREPLLNLATGKVSHILLSFPREQP